MKKCIKSKEANMLPLGGSVKEYFWNFWRPFLLNKGSLNNCEIMLRKEKKIITDTKEIVQVLNHHYINIVERSCGEKPTSVAKQSYLTDDIKIVDHIVFHDER